jgi:5-methylcytosine-specific restriction endonuclease McrA
MPITRSGYAKQRRNGSTRAYRKARELTLKYAYRCHICGGIATHDDPLEADHIIAHADNGTHTLDNLRPAHRSCNRRRGRT